MPSTDPVGNPDASPQAGGSASPVNPGCGWVRVRSWLLPTDHTGGGYWEVVRYDAPRVGFCLLFVFASGLGQTFLLSLFQPHWMRDFGLSAGAMGLVYGIATLASGLLLPLAGRWLDRTHPTTAGLITLVCLAGFGALAAVASHLWMLGVAIFGLRFFGQGLSSNVGVTNAARWFTTNRGKALSLAGLGFPLSEGLLPGLITIAVASVGWRGTWSLLACICALIFIPTAAALASRHPPVPKDVEAVRAQRARAVAARRRLIRDWRFYAMLGMLAPLPFIGTGIIFFQSILASGRGWSAAVFPTGFLMFAIIRALCSLSTGAWVDRLGAVGLLALPPLTLVVGLASLLRPEPAWAYVFFVLFGLSHGSSGAINTAAWTEMFGTDCIGAIRGLSSSFTVFLTAAAPAAFGFALDHAVTAETLILGSALLVLVTTWPLSVVMRQVQLRHAVTHQNLRTGAQGNSTM